MPFLSTETLKKILVNNNIIDPYNPENVKCSAYELNLGDEAYVTDNKSKSRKLLRKNEQIVIPRGQFALLITKEILSIPNEYICFISMKYSYKKKGLINISGFHVDPGFKGRLQYSVYNAGGKDIILEHDKPLFLIWFATLDTPNLESYKGTHPNQYSISAEDIMNIQGDVVSPSFLKEQLDKIKTEVKNLKTLVYIIIACLFTLLISQNLKCNCNSAQRVSHNSSTNQPIKNDSLY